jgi:flotillin
MEFFCAIAALVIFLLIAIVVTIKNVFYVCQPNEVLIFSGREHVIGNLQVGYRVIKGGNAIRLPIIETVDRMDLTNMIIDLTVKNAYSRGGIPLTVQAVANVKIPGEMPLLHNALERFLARTREEIMQIARETLEGNLRGVLATLTPEQVNMDKEAFASKLTEEAEHDLNRIGIVLDTLKIQNVGDEVGYLDAIGRMRSAHARRNAQIAEALTQSSAAEVKWRNYMTGEVSKLDAQVNIARKENERRIADATTRREAVIAEQVGEVQGLTAQARAEIGMQEARIEQVRLRLQADVVQPAEARKNAAVAKAKADATRIIEQGKATAGVLTNLAAQYRASGSSARDVLLMQKLVPIMHLVAGTIGELKVDRLTVLGQGFGGSGDGGSLARTLVGASEQIRAATGVDLTEVARQKLGGMPPVIPQRPLPPKP